MRKITLLLMTLFSVAAFSQVEVVENFDSASNNGQVSGWTDVGFSTSTSAPCGGSGLSEFANVASGGTASLTTPLYSAITNNTDLIVSFDYNIFEVVFGFPPSFNAPPAGWGSIVLEYTVDNGANWTTITTINDASFTFVDMATCVSSGVINVGTLAASNDFQARFSINNDSDVNLSFSIDNVSLLQSATTVPNCDAVMTSATTDVEPDTLLEWSSATGIATGYKVYVGTETGLTDVVNGDTTTETSYSLTGLTYEEDYFVTIVPFNGFGDAASCTEESFVVRSAPLVGATCSSPKEITFTGGFYVDVADTANYENNIDVSPCSNSYMRGNDVYYSITPTSDVSINIDVTGLSNNGAGIHVLDGCPDTATTCVAYSGTYANTDRNLSEIVLTAGTTYFLVMSNSSATRTYSYNLIITENPCINPEFTLTPTPDCGSGEFKVDVNVTYMGDATTLTLQDSNGGVVNNISSTGIVEMGPYTSGQTITFDLINDDETSCSYNDSTFFYCPPANDDCLGSIALDVNTDDTCTLYTSATNAGAIHSNEANSACSTGDSNDVWFSFVADGNTIVVEYLNITAAIGDGGTIQSTELFEGSACGSLTSVDCKDGNYAIFSGLTDGNTYYIRNYTRLGTNYAQNYDICLKTPPVAPVNDECANATTLTVSTDETCNNGLVGETTVGATRSTESTCADSVSTTYSDVWYVFNPAVSGVYEFSFDKTSGAASRYFIYKGTCGALTEVSTSCGTTSNQIVTMDSSETFYIMVQSSQSEPGAIFDLCVWQLPDPVSNDSCETPGTLTESPDSNGANAISGTLADSYPSIEHCSSNNVVWYSFIPSLTGIYHFDYTRVSGTSYFSVFSGDCSDLQQDVTGLTSCYLSGERTGELVANQTYLVAIHASSSTAEFSLMAYPDPSLSIETSNDFNSFKYYPNPVVNTLMIESANTMSKISIRNLVGQEVVRVTPNSLKTQVNMNDLNNGVYFVTVNIGNSQKTFKVIKK